jgi:hypothetical protein
MSNASNASYARYYGIPETAALKMAAEMDTAAKAFWAYPDAAWQAAFQAEWLESHGYREAAAKARQ